MFYQQQLSKTQARHAPGFWDAWTCALTQVGTFSETFETIASARTQLAQETNEQHAHELGRDAAWRLCLRAYRGITKPETYGVGFLRDHLYRSGLLDVHDAIEAHGEQVLEDLFVGNVGLNDLEGLSGHELPGAKTPELISKAIVKKYL